MQLKFYFIHKPIVGALFLALLPQGKNFLQVFRDAMLFFQLLALGAGLYLVFLFDTQFEGYQFVEKIDWISFLGISYSLIITLGLAGQRVLC